MANDNDQRAFANIGGRFPKDRHPDWRAECARQARVARIMGRVHEALPVDGDYDTIIEALLNVLVRMEHHRRKAS